jgi:quercetin dioxygenase-like cupin family protein
MNTFKLASSLLLLALTAMPNADLFSAESPGSVPAATPARIGSTVFKWEDLKVKPTGVGMRRDVSDNPTPTLETFECHISTLNAGAFSHPPHTHPQEELIILKEGTLDVLVNGTTQHAGPGSLIFFASNDPHAVHNVSDKPATYFVFNFATAVTRTLRGGPATGVVPGRRGSTVFEWEKLPVKKTEVGERREVTDLPTATLRNLECHITTIRAGESPHAPHRHPDEEIILVKEGLVEATINGHSQRVGPGSILFYASGDEHGMKNVGDTTATYYVLRLVTEKTPKAANEI